MKEPSYEITSETLPFAVTWFSNKLSDARSVSPSINPIGSLSTSASVDALEIILLSHKNGGDVSGTCHQLTSYYLAYLSKEDRQKLQGAIRGAKKRKSPKRAEGVLSIDLTAEAAAALKAKARALNITPSNLILQLTSNN